MYEMDPACASVCLCVCLPCIRTPIRIPIFSSFSAVFAGNNKSNCNNHSKCYTNSRKLLPKVTLLRYFSFFCYCLFTLGQYFYVSAFLCWPQAGLAPIKARWPLAIYVCGLQTARKGVAILPRLVGQSVLLDCQRRECGDHIGKKIYILFLRNLSSRVYLQIIKLFPTVHWRFCWKISLIFS